MPKLIEILRPGSFRSMQGEDVTFTSADLAEIASAYSPSLHEAPIVVGHPATNAPAYGWAAGLRVEGDRLVCEADQVDPAFADLVAAGRFKKLSPSFYAPASPNNPTPGKWYLRHIGFLGAQPPAIKGLRDASFADAQAVTLDFGERWTWPLGSIADALRRLRDYFVEKEGAERGDQILPLWMIDSVTTAVAEERARESAETPAFADSDAPGGEPEKPGDVETGSPTAPAAGEPAAGSSDIDARAAELDRRERELAERERAAASKARADDSAAFCERMVGEGRLLPREVPLVSALLTLPAGEVSFADGEAAPVTLAPAEALKRLIAGRPPLIDFAEKSRESAAAGVVDFAAPAGERVSETGLTLHRRATAWLRAHPESNYQAAIRAVQEAS